MFAYIDPSIRERLVAAGQLIRIDADGRQIDIDGTGDNGSDLTINLVGAVPLPVDVGGREVIFRWYAFVRHTELSKAEEIASAVRQRGDKRLFPLLSTHMAVNSALVHGNLDDVEAPLVRVHSNCLTGDVFGSKRCECGPQLQSAMARICEEDAGAIIYMSGHEGRGIGLWAKAITYLLQDAGQDTYQANRSLGLPDDSRDFSDAAAMLLYLLKGDRAIRLMTNNPKKRTDLTAGGLSQLLFESHVAGVNQYNIRYLRAKRDWGHSLGAAALQDVSDAPESED